MNSELTLRGITKSADAANKLVQVHDSSQEKKEVFGADASAKFMRDDFGIDYVKEYGFKIDIHLKIGVEAFLE